MSEVTVSELELHEKLAEIERRYAEASERRENAALTAKKVKWYEVMFIGGGAGAAVMLLIEKVGPLLGGS